MRTVPEIRAFYNRVVEDRKHVCTDGEVTQEDLLLTPGAWMNRFCRLRVIRSDGTLGGIFTRGGCNLDVDEEWFNDVGVLLATLEKAINRLDKFDQNPGTTELGLAEFLTAELKR